MFKVAKLAESTLVKIAPSIGKAVPTVGKIAVKGSLTALKMTSSMIPMVGSALLGGLIFFYQFLK